MFVLSRLSGRSAKVHILESMEMRLPCAGLSCLPVSEEELGKSAQQDIQRQSYSSLSLWNVP